MRLLCVVIVIKLPDGDSLEGMIAVLEAGVVEARDICRAHRDSLVLDAGDFGQRLVSEPGSDATSYLPGYSTLRYLWAPPITADTAQRLDGGAIRKKVHCESRMYLNEKCGLFLLSLLFFLFLFLD